MDVYSFKRLSKLPSRIHQRNPCHIIIKLLKTPDKRKLLKAADRKEAVLTEERSE